MNPLLHTIFARFQSYRTKILLSILTPVSVILSVFLLLSWFLLSTVTSQLQEHFALGHKKFVDAICQEFESLSQSTLLLTSNQVFKDVYFASKPLESQNYYLFKETVSLLSFYSSMKPYLFEIGFFSLPHGRFVSSLGTTSFSKEASLQKILSAANNLSLQRRNNSIFEIQPSVLYRQQRLIPLLQTSAGGLTLPLPLVLMISPSAFSSMIANYTAGADAHLFIFSQSTGEMLAATNPDTAQKVIELLHSQPSLPTGNQPPLLIPDGEYLYYMCSAATPALDSLICISAIPRTFLTAQMQSLWLLSFAVVIGCCIFTSVFSLRSAVKLYHPIKALHTHLQISDYPPAQGDEISDIDARIQTLLRSNHRLQEDMNCVLPSVYTQYILNILYQEPFENEKLENLLAHTPFHFSYEYFTCAAIVLKFTDAFYNDFSKASQMMIRQKLVGLLGFTASEGCVLYPFKTDETQFCIICNSRAANGDSILLSSFETLRETFSFDKEYVRLYCSLGKTQHGIESLHLSWTQACIAMAQLSRFSQNNISVFRESAVEHGHYQLPASYHTKLETALYQGDQAAAISLLQDALKQNQEANITDHAFAGLYARLYEIVESAIHRLRIEKYPLLEDSHLSLGCFMGQLNNIDRSEYLHTIIGHICDYQKHRTASSFNLAEIKAFIDSHYQDDLYLDSLADKYHTSPKYMSRILKQALGTPFKQYLLTLRVLKAQELLLETNLKIDDIALQSGFRNRNSFIRSFKQITELAPGEYRAIHRAVSSPPPDNKNL